MENKTNNPVKFFLVLWMGVFAFLVGSYFLAFIETTLEALVGYTLSFKNTSLYLVSIYLILSLNMLVGGLVTNKKVIFRHNAHKLLDLFFLNLPVLVLISLLIVALRYLDLNKPLDSQYYYQVFESYRGKVLIHFIPSVLCWKILNNDISRQRGILLVFLMLAYSVLYSERAFFLYILLIILLLFYQKFTFSFKNFVRISTLSLLGLAVFVMIESSRSGASLATKHNDYSLTQYGVERFVLYYKDTTIKSSNCLNGLIEKGLMGCSRSSNEHGSVTNRGGVFMLFSEKGLFGGLFISAIMFFLSGIVMMQTVKKSEFFVLIFPQFYIFCLEFNRLNRLDFNQPYFVVLTFFIFFLVFMKRN